MGRNENVKQVIDRKDSHTLEGKGIFTINL